MFKHVLIATDGSELADKGVDRGLDLAKLFGARVTLITVTQPLSFFEINETALSGVENPFGRYEQKSKERAAQITAPIESKAAQLGLVIETIHETDDSPAEAIVRTAQAKDCDLIVMSSHGRRGLSKVLLGSQTAEVLVRTTVPVLVIR